MKKLLFYIKQYLKMFLQSVVLPIYYKLCCKKQINEKLVIFADAHNHSLPYSMKLLREKFVNEGYEVEECISDYGHDGFLTTTKNMFAFMKKYANAKYVIICDYFLPVASANKREETKVIQLWHACGIYKKFAFDSTEDIPQFYKGVPTKNLNLVTVSSPICEEVYSKAMRLPKGTVRALGVSRTDCFFDEGYLNGCRENFYKMYPQAKGRKILLWAPTFRGNAGQPEIIGTKEMSRLIKELPEEWFVITKLHPHFKKEAKNQCPIPTEQLLPVADLLVSDYSTVVFEYSLMKKPTVLFVPDYETYFSKRGFYIVPEQITSLIAKDYKQLFELVTTCEKRFCAEENANVIKTYMSGCDGNSTQRIFEEIKKL